MAKYGRYSKDTDPSRVQSYTWCKLGNHMFYTTSHKKVVKQDCGKHQS